jgi:YesN/AraC family two-component response regulator
VAEETGFPNYRYFSMVFKKHLGSTPKEFRKV